jgi:hypothetical protein
MFRPAAYLRFFRGWRDREVHLSFEDINARHKNRELVANPESPA